MFMLSRVSRITLPTFIIKEQNPDLLSYRTFSTVTLSFLTRPGKVSHQAGRWASASPCRSFPPPGLLHHTRCWSSASALSHPCIFLFNRVLDRSVHCFFSFQCDAVLGRDFQIRGAFLSCHISEVGTKNPVSPSAGMPDLLTTFKLCWAAVTRSSLVLYPPRSNSPGSSLHPWNHLHDLLEARCYQSLCLTFFLSKPFPHFHSYLNLLLQIFQTLEHHFVNVVQQCVGDFFWCGLG